MYSWEQVVRFTASVILVGYPLIKLAGSLIGYGLIATGLMLGVTGLVGWCPMCAIAGRKINSTGTKEGR